MRQCGCADLSELAGSISDVLKSHHKGKILQEPIIFGQFVKVKNDVFR